MQGIIRVDLRSERLTQAAGDLRSELFVAASKGNTRLVDSLVDGGANVNYANSLGVTPLLIACVRGNIAVVETLLKKGRKGRNHAAFIAATGFGLTRDRMHVAQPQQVSCMSCLSPGTMRHILEFLTLSKHANVDKKTKLECGFASPLFVASERGFYRVVKALLEANADPNLCNEAGMR
jgi:ankyrin repeat protein